MQTKNFYTTNKLYFYLVKNFKYFLLNTLALILSSQLSAATYYVASNGNDSNDGQSTSTPWKTIAGLNQKTFSPNDVVLFRTGDTFYGKINLKSGVTYSSYGSGPVPIISGAVPITGWTPYGSQGVYKVKLTDSLAVRNLFVNSQQMTIARYPDSGFLYANHGNGKIGFSDPELPSGTNWVGANIRIATLNYLYETKKVTSYNSGNIVFNTISIENIADSTAYFVDNKLSLLDKAGEWFYNPLDSTVYLYPPVGIDINNCIIEGAVYDYGFSCEACANATIKNLKIVKQRLDGISIRNSSSTVSNNIKIENTFFANQLRNGISIQGTNMNITKDTLENINGKGIEITNCTSSSITSNALKNIGLIPGYGTSGYNGATGIATQDVNLITISKNNISYTGYNGIRCDGTNITVEKNNISYPLITCTDGGGIYTWGTYSHQIIIKNNFISYPQGFDNGAPGGLAVGIYVDNYASYVDVLNNTIIESNKSGIFLNAGVYNCNVKGNISYGNKLNQFRISDYIDTLATYGNKVYKNTFYSIDQNATGLLENHYFEGRDLAVTDSNFYCNPYSDYVLSIFKEATSSTSNYSINQWKTLTSEDVTSKTSFAQLDNCGVVSITESNLITNGNFNSNILGWRKHNSATTIQYTTGQLDGGSLKFTSTDVNPQNNVMAISPQFAITKDQYYLLTFSVKSSGPCNIEAIIRQDNGVTYDEYFAKKFYIDNNRKDIRQIVKISSSDSKVRLDFQIYAPDHEFWIDNVQLVPINASCMDPKDQSKLFTNTTDNTVNVSLGGNTYRDLNGNIVKGTVALEPWYSKVLVLERIPSVSIVTPILNAEYSAPASITIEANASVVDASISRVEIFLGAVKIGDFTTPPYRVTWSNVVLGNYSITAKATDSRGMMSVSAPVLIRVNSAPSFTEAENNYAIVTDAGTNSAIGITSCPTGLSNNAAVKLYDKNDKIQFNFTTSEAGMYKISVRLRTGDSRGSTVLANSYAYTINGISKTFTLDAISVSASSTCLGTSYWGKVISPVMYLQQGVNYFTVESLTSWTGVDNFEVVFTPHKYEAESHFQIISDLGTNSILSYTCPGTTLSNLAAIRTFDLNDKFGINFYVSENATYKIIARLRSGDATGPSTFGNGYAFTLDNAAQTFTLNFASISALSTTCLGQSYWGNFQSGDLSLTSGNHYLSLDAIKTWGSGDYIEIVKTNAGSTRADIEVSDATGLTSSPILNIYPNPVKNEFMIDFNSSYESIATIELLDIFGRMVMKDEKAVISGLNNYVMSVKDIKTGFYLVSISQNDHRIIKKIYVEE
ncbi:T9SS type A sorting domain-containing protein [Sporocytophaga myxococcoides]|uniref:T9SS type A sorting domain-containing protein n=1 Tax=Sporocytophaga myxococcoides TaxID=153721 RepID=UPI00040DBFA5|nr:T9SS type A sorting domain-containing protein [Sporocytophaga myxococcoides]